jgi:hypothetical protein
MPEVKRLDGKLGGLLGGEACPFVPAFFSGRQSLLKVSRGLIDPVIRPVRHCMNNLPEQP